MSHHFSPDFTVLPTGKEPVSKKLQRNNEQTSSARQRETQKLDLDNKQMEWKLNQLKQAMSKEKEDRSKQASIWKSGSAKIESHSRNILGRTVSATVNGAQRTSPKSGSKSAPKSKPPGKVRILRDEPLDLPQRDSRTKDLIRKLQEENPPAEEPRRIMDYETPRKHEYWIHFALDRNSNDVFELQSDLDGNLPLSAIQAMEPSAVGVFFKKWGRKRLLIAASGVIRKPKSGWGDEVYYPYVAKSLPEMAMKPEPPLRNVSNTMVRSPVSEEKENRGGGLLLRGTFDEEKNAETFQQALNEWRSGNSENREVKSQPEMSVHVAQCTPEPFEVKFSETSTLSYMEHVLLQKHRTSQVPPMPRSLTDAVNGYLGNGEEDNIGSDDAIFTAEEEDERQRYRELFTPDLSNSRKFASAKVLSISEIDVEENLDTTDNCFVEESPPVTPTPSISRSNQMVVIEEISYDVTMSENNFQHPETKMSGGRSMVQKKGNISARSPETIGTPPPKKHVDRSGKDKRHNKSQGKQRNQPNRVPLSEVRKSETDLNRDSQSIDKNREISQNPFSLIHEIGKIPINPDAIYHKGLNEFFGDVRDVQKEDIRVQNSDQNLPPLESKMAETSSNWNPISSVVDVNADSNITINNHEETESQIMERQSEMCDNADNTLSSSVIPAVFTEDMKSPPGESVEYDNNGDNTLLESVSPAVYTEKKKSPAEESEQYDTKSLTDNESADERALDDLEWELASRTGNLTADGRISRLIDEWSQEDDLEIIDDPGDGSGLSTPDVRSNSISKVSVTDPNDPLMQHDFRNMEKMIMGDLSDEYSEEEL